MGHCRSSEVGFSCFSTCFPREVVEVSVELSLDDKVSCPVRLLLSVGDIELMSDKWEVDDTFVGV